MRTGGFAILPKVARYPGCSMPSNCDPTGSEYIRPVENQGMSCVPVTIQKVPYVKNTHMEKVFPRIHSPTAAIIWIMPPKKMNTQLQLVSKWVVSRVPECVVHESASLSAGASPSHVGDCKWRC